MKPPAFNYFAPDTVEEVLALLAEHGDEARPLAGGQSLVPMMNMRIVHPAVLVDLNRVSGLDDIRADDGILVVGPMVRQSKAERSDLVRRICPLLTQTLRHVGVPAVKNRGTIGGSLAHADPVAELPGTALALGADLIIESKDARRTVTPGAFYIAQLTTAIEPGEMLREIRFPKIADGTKTAFVESGNRQEGLAIAGVACAVQLDEAGICRAVSLTAIGVSAVPSKLNTAESILLGHSLEAAVITEAAEAVSADIDPWDDVHAPAHYRRRLAAALVTKALKQAIGTDGPAAQ